MTTNNMFLRDMKTMKRNMNEMRGLNTMLAKAVLLMLLFLCGGIVSKVWGDTRVVYYILNNSGRIAAAQYQSGNGQQVGRNWFDNNQCMKSPLATSYKFYTSATETIAGSGIYEVDTSSEVAEGSSLTNNQDYTIWVRYTVDNSMGWLNGNYFTIAFNNNDSYMVYNAGNSGEKITIQRSLPGNTGGWQFVGTDPYDLTLKNQNSPDKYVHLDTSNSGLVMSDDPDDETHFCLLFNRNTNSSSNPRAYHLFVMGDISTASEWDSKYVRSLGSDNTNGKQVFANYGSGSQQLRDIGGGTKAWLVEKQTEYTYKVIDNDGNLALSGQTTATTLAIPDKMKSPLLSDADYVYYKNMTGDDTNGYDISTGTQIASLSELDSPDSPVFVRYTYNKNSTISSYYSSNGNHQMQLDGTTTYAIWANDRYMHPTYRNDESNSDNNWTFALNSKDVYSGGNTILASTLPFTDVTYQWQLLNEDPYNIKLYNPASSRYLTIGSWQLSISQTDANDVSFSLLYWNGDATGNEYMLMLRSSNPSWNGRFLRMDSGYDDWRSTTEMNNVTSKINIKTLPQVNINIVNASGDIESTIVGYYKSDATLPAFTPYFIQRAFTSSHTFYYDAACTQQIATGSALDGSKFDGNNVYVKYTLDDGWNTLFPTIVTNPEDINDWYAVEFSTNATGTDVDNTFLAVNASTLIAERYNTNAKSSSASIPDNKRAHWAFSGTPYALKIHNQQAGEGFLLGIDRNGTRAQINAISDVTSYNTWELVTGLRGTAVSTTDNKVLHMRLQNSFNKQSPLTYLGYSNLSHNIEVTSNPGGTFQLKEITLADHLQEYTFHIVDRSGHKAIKATGKWPVGGTLRYNAIPEEIRSPYIADETLTFYTTATKDADGNTNDRRETFTLSDNITAPTADISDIYVSYTVNHLSEKQLDFSGTRQYYIQAYDDKFVTKLDLAGGAGWSQEYYHGSLLTAEQIAYHGNNDNAFWSLIGNDPYNVRIKGHAFWWFSQNDKGYVLRFQNVDNNYPNIGVILMPDADNASTFKLLCARHDTDDRWYFRRQSGSSTDVADWIYTGTTNDEQCNFRFYPVIHYRVFNQSGTEAIDWRGPSTFTADGSQVTVSLPAGVRSPLIPAEDFTLHTISKDGEAITAPISRSISDVFVTYTTANMASYVNLVGGSHYNIKQPADSEGSSYYYWYRYADSDYHGRINVNNATTTANKNENKYRWELLGNDPYAVEIRNWENTDYQVTANFGNAHGEIYSDQTVRKWTRFLLLGQQGEADNSGKYRMMVSMTRENELNMNSYDWTLSWRKESSTPDDILHPNNFYIPYQTIVEFESDLSYRVINLSGKEAIVYKPESEDVSKTKVLLPDQFKSPLAKEYKYYPPSQMNYDSSTGVFSAKEGATPLSENSDVNSDVIFVTYEYDAEAGVDLSGATSYGMFINGADEKGYRMLGFSPRYQSRTNLPVYTQPLEPRKHYSWYLNGGAYNDPYDVTFKNEYSNRYQYINDKNDNLLTEPNSSSSATHFMILAGSSTDRYEVAYMKNNVLRRLYYYGSSSDNGIYSGTGCKEEKAHETDICQIAFTPLYIFHVINFDGKKVISAPGDLVKGENTTLELPHVISSPLIDHYYYYNATDVTNSEDVYTLNTNATNITTLNQVSGQDIYVFYRQADINESLDLTGQVAYNLKANGYYSFYNAGNDYVWHTSTPEDATADDYLWMITGNDPYNIQFYNVKQGMSVPLTMNSNYTHGGDARLVSVKSLGSNTAANSFIITRGLENHYEVLLAYTSGTSYPSPLSADYFHYLAQRTNDNPTVTHNENIYHLTGDNYTIFDIVPARNSELTYIVVNKRGTRALKVTLDAAVGVAPDLPVALKSPYATNFTYHTTQENTSTNLATTTIGGETIYVYYDINTEKASANPLISGGGNGKFFYLNANEGHYGYVNADEYNTAASGAKVEEDDEENGGHRYAWTLQAPNGGDPYDITIRAPYYPTKALGTPQYSRPASAPRRAPAEHEYDLQLYDDESPNVMRFALLEGSNLSGHYALVAARGVQVAGEIYGNMLDYVGCQTDGTLKLLQVSIDNVDDAAQLQFEDYELKQQYTYHIVDAQDKSTVLEVATTAVEGGINVGGMASSFVPDVLKRKGAKLVYFDEHATNAAQNTTTPVNVYTTGYELFQLGFNTNIYVGYEIDEEDLGFKYSGTLAELSSLPDDDLEDLNWNLWQVDYSTDSYNKRYFYSQGDGNALGRSDKLTTQPTDNNAYLWAFFGDPYRTKIINKATGKSAFLAVSTNKPGNNPNPEEAYIYVSSNETNFAHNNWGYSLHTEIGTSETYQGQFFLNNVTYEGKRYYIDARGWERAITGLGDQEYVIIPLINWTYHVINLSGQQAITAKVRGIGTGYTASLPDIVKAYGVSSYSYYSEANTELTEDARAFTGSPQTTFTATTDGEDIYVKYMPDNSALAVFNNKPYLIEKEYSNRYGNLLQYDENTGTVTVSGNNQHNNLRCFFLPTLYQTTDGDWDPYQLTLLNFLTRKPLGNSSDNSTLRTAEGLDQCTFILQEGGIASSVGYGTNDFSLLLTNSDDNGALPYTYLYFQGGVPVMTTSGSYANATTNPVRIGLYPRELYYKYYIYDLDGNEAVRALINLNGGSINMGLEVPTAIKSPLPSAYQFWKSRSDALAYRNGNSPTQASSLTECELESGNNGNGPTIALHITYDFKNNVNGVLDLSGENHYNINFISKDGTDDTPYYWIPSSSSLAGDSDNPSVRAYPLTDDKVNGTFGLLDDAALWKLTNSDPYAVTFQNMSLPDYSSFRKSVDIGNYEYRYAMSMHTGSVTPENRFCLVGEANKDGLFELLTIDGRNKGDTRLNLVLTSNGTAVSYKAYYDNGRVYSGPNTEISGKRAQIRFTPRSSDYLYNIINLSGEKALVYTGKGMEGKNAKNLPPAVQSPMAQNFKFYQKSQFDINTVGGVTTYTLKSGEEPYELFPPTTNADGETIVPELYVLYEPKTVEDVNLEAGRYYYLKAAGKYAHTDSYGTALDVADNPTKTAPDVDWFMWVADANNDPYNVRLQEKEYIRYLSAEGFTEESTDLSLNSSGTVQRFCLLPGNGSRSDLYTMVAASGDDITDNMFAYVGYDGEELKLLRGEELGRTTARVQVELEVPKFNYTYKVVNHAGEIAIQYTEEQKSAADPALPNAIKSPFADVTGYYLVGQYNVTTGTPDTYALKSNQKTLEDVGGLPYADTDIYVEYVYNGSTEGLNITGKYYNLKADADGKYAYKSGTTIATTATKPTSLATADYMWAPTGDVNNDGTDIDPYQVTLKGYDTNTLSKGKYIPLKGAADGQWALLKATGTTLDPGAEGSSDSFQYLYSNGTDALDDADGTINDANAQLWFHGVPVKITYAVLSKTKGWIAIKGDFWQEGGEKPELPDLLKSPLAYNYNYHGSATPNGTTIKDVANNYFETVYTAGAILDLLPYSTSTVYVTYDYDNSTSPIDLGGGVKYNISSDNHYVGAKDETAVKSDYHRHLLQNADSPEKTTLATKNYIWRLIGNDPYNVQVTNLVCKDTYTKGSNSTSYHLTINNNFNNAGAPNVDPNVSAEFSGTFCLLNGYTKVADALAYALVVTFPHAQAEAYYNDHPLLNNNRNAYLFFCYNSTTRSPNALGFSSSTYTWGYQQGGRTATDSLTIPFATLVFTPNQTQPVMYHLTQKITLQQHEYKEDAAAVRSPLEIPKQWERKFCDYTYTYYYKEKAYTDPDTDEELDVPVTKEEFEAKTDPDATYKEATTTIVPRVYIEIDPETMEPAEGQKLDIYVNYTVKDYGEEGGIPFRRMAKDKATVDALLDKENGVLETVFDLSSYEKLNETLYTGLKRKDYLYFMVMNTNDDYTRGKQYFLRREDNGRISWLNNDYKLTVEPDAQGHTYSRQAESYRKNDHDPFQEKHWLWCFAGDPYDMYIYNINAVVEETFNNATSQTQFVATHRDHMVNWMRLSDSEYAVNTPGYAEAEPTSYRWGLAEGKGTNSDQTFSLMAGQMTTGTDSKDHFDPNLDDSPLYWKMQKSKVENTEEVLLTTRSESTTELDYNINVLPYVPVRYEDVELVIRRDDEIKKFQDDYSGITTRADLAANSTAQTAITNMKTGLHRLYFAAADRVYAAGDNISKDDMPVDVKRAFCDYTFYTNVWKTEGAYTVTSGPYRGDPQYESDGTTYKLDDNKEIIYNYYDTEEDALKAANGETTGLTISSPNAPQRVYVKYKVTEDIFLTEDALPSIDSDESGLNTKVASMANNNDHVFFMDFTDNKTAEGYDQGQHAYFSEGTTFEEVFHQTFPRDVDYNYMVTHQPEKLKWNASKTDTENDTEHPFNDCEFKTTKNRMESEPERLKWYFVGDPYSLQVFCTKKPGYNLARFDETETNYRFVIDCVHLRKPEEGADAPWDQRTTVRYYEDEAGTKITDVQNPEYGEFYYKKFKWEMVPAASQREGTFALRFKADNELMSYRNVYYYLVHDGTRKDYYATSESATQQKFPINLDYDPQNARQLKGKYLGYHEANGDDAVIRLVKPAKVLVSAYAATNQDSPSFSAATQKTTDELSEYFGVGETLKNVPQHLRRKYVKYPKLRWYDMSNSATEATFDFTLAEDKLNSQADCSAHPLGTDGGPYDDRLVAISKINPKFKLDVLYTLDDMTTEVSTGNVVHMFTPESNYNSGTGELTSPVWLDLMVGWNNWLYYDKTRRNQDGTTPTDFDTYVSNFNGRSGWDTGLKGLHWALVGDPYSFIAINRRKYDDNASAKYLAAYKDTRLTDLKTGAGENEKTIFPKDTTVWVTKLVDKSVITATPESSGLLNNSSTTMNTHWSFIWKKTGADGYIRTASLKTTTDDPNNGIAGNQTNNFYRLGLYGYTAENQQAGLTSMYITFPFSLETKESDIATALIRTAVVEDNDAAKNDCFDANIRIYQKDGTLVKAFKDRAELRYGDPIESLPVTLRRYGCSYTCYLGDYAKIVKNETGSRPQLTQLLPSTVTGDLDNYGYKDTESNTYPVISYVYTVDDDISSFFTTAEEQRQDQYTWANAYFNWTEIIKTSGVTTWNYTLDIVGYLYDAEGKVQDVIRDWVGHPVTSDGSSTPTAAYGWMNSHSDGSQAYGNEPNQNDDNSEKWAFVGDPYDFQLKNYAKYIGEDPSSLSYNEAAKTINFSDNEDTHWALAVNASGTCYLALLDSDGNILKYVTFDRMKNNNVLPADQQFLYGTGSANSLDPTGNLFDTGGAKSFNLKDLSSYAQYVIYHLVIAHQHSTDYIDQFDSMTAAEKTAAQAKIRKHLAEFLHYKMGAKADNYVEETAFNYSDYASGSDKGMDKYIKYDFKSGYVDADGKFMIPGEDETTIKNLLKHASLRDLVTYPVENYNAYHIGIGNRLSVPWYMDRQFCNYTLYQRDVLRSEQTGVQAQTSDGRYIWQNTTTGDIKYTTTQTSPGAGYTPVNDTKWQSVKSTDKNGDVIAHNGQPITMLLPGHKDRVVLVDVVYDVDEKQFEFSDRGRNTTKWYQMMTNNEADGLMNFSYKDGIGARPDYTAHYTNNYLWAPAGDPYGFVLHNRYATINGSGWDNVVVTTKEQLPKKAGDISSDMPDCDASYTSQQNFYEKRVVHITYDESTTTPKTAGAENAVYEMFKGRVNNQSFLMHPTSAWINIEGDAFGSYYMVHNTSNHKAQLKYNSSTIDLREDLNANWRLVTTPEQLLPYFERAGYVGALTTTAANDNQSYYTELQSGSASFETLSKIRDLVYGGTFYKRDGSELVEGSPRPTAKADLPLRFRNEHLVSLDDRYFRIEAFSREGLDKDGEAINGITGPRFISGFLHKSAMDMKGYDKDTKAQIEGSRMLHFLETDEEHSKFRTFGDLNKHIDALPHSDEKMKERDFIPHPSMRGNIEILPADYDPSSIFYFEPENTELGRYTLSTQGLYVNARAGAQGEGDVDGTGYTKMTTLKAEATPFRIDDIGGAAVTLRTGVVEPAGYDANGALNTWDTDQTNGVEKNLQTNYLCIDARHRYRITVHTDNEMKEISDTYHDWESGETKSYGIQDTKWMLKPVGIPSEWPENNSMPLKLEVQQGEETGEDLDGNPTYHWYSSLYVPYDTRLNSTADIAFTCTVANPGPASLVMNSVSQLNGMGNPQFIPAQWPVVVRSNNPKTATIKRSDGTTDTKHYVNLYLPNSSPSDELNYTELGGKLMGEYLEQELTGTSGTIMVFGRPFVEEGTTSNNPDEMGAAGTHKATDYYAYQTDEEGKPVKPGFYQNQNWWRGHYGTTLVEETATNDGTLAKSFLATARTATRAQRSNHYVYHNKLYYDYVAAPGSPAPRFIQVVFDDGQQDGDDEEDKPIQEEVRPNVPWPCDVYDLQGRKVAEQETPATLLKNYPQLSKGVYIFGGRKVIVK